jgi:hypothetical protein
MYEGKDREDAGVTCNKSTTLIFLCTRKYADIVENLDSRVCIDADGFIVRTSTSPVRGGTISIEKEVLTFC